MALQIAIEDNNTGVEFNYWRLGNVILFHDRKICKIEILGFLNRDKYLADKTKFIARQYEISGEDYDIYFAPDVLNAEGLNPQRQAYLYLKTLPDFINSIDIDV